MLISTLNDLRSSAINDLFDLVWFQIIQNTFLIMPTSQSYHFTHKTIQIQNGEIFSKSHSQGTAGHEF